MSGVGKPSLGYRREGRDIDDRDIKDKSKTKKRDNIDYREKKTIHNKRIKLINITENIVIKEMDIDKDNSDKKGGNEATAAEIKLQAPPNINTNTHKTISQTEPNRNLEPKIDCTEPTHSYRSIDIMENLSTFEKMMDIQHRRK